MQPVVIRHLVQEGQTFVYIVNDSPWPVTLKMRIEAPAGCRLDPLGATPAQSRRSRGWRLEVDLRPYDLVGGRFSSPSVKLSQPTVEIAEQAQADLRRKIHELNARGPLPWPIRRRCRLRPIPTSSSRAPRDKRPAGRCSNHEGASITLASETPHSGKQSLRLVNRGQDRHAAQHAISDSRNRPAHGRALAARPRSGNNNPRCDWHWKGVWTTAECTTTLRRSERKATGRFPKSGWSSVSR